MPLKFLIISLLLGVCCGAPVPAYGQSQNPGATTTSSTPAPTEQELRAAFPDSRGPLTETYSTAGHPRAHGTRISFKHPAAWIPGVGKPEEGKADSMLQTFTVPGLKDSVSISVIPLRFSPDAPFTPQQQERALHPDTMAKFLEVNAVILSSLATISNGAPASILEWSLVLPGDGRTLHVRQVDFNFIQAGNWVRFSCMVSTTHPEHARLLPAHMKEMKPFFQAMVDSMIMEPDGAPAQAAATAPAAAAPAATSAAPSAPASQPAPTEQELRAAFPDSRGPLTQTFSTVGHARSRGTRISFRHPAAWIPAEGRPKASATVVQTFTVPGLKDSAMIRVIPLVFSPGAPFTPEQQHAAMQPDRMAKALPRGAILHSSRATTFDGAPACILEWSAPLPDAEDEPYFRQIDFSFLQSGNWVMFSCFVGTMSAAHAHLLPAHMEEMRPLYQAMAESITVVQNDAPSKATTTTTTTTPGAAPSTPAPQPAPTPQQLRAAFWDTRGALTQSYSTAGNPKARGIDLRLKFPAEWLAKDLHFLANLQAFIYLGSQDHVALDLVPVTGDAQADLDAILSVYGYADFVPAGAEFQDGGATTLGGKRAAWVMYTSRQLVGDTTEHSLRIRYVLAHGSTQVHLTGSVSTDNPARIPLLPAHMEEMRPLYQAMAESIIIQAKH